MIDAEQMEQIRAILAWSLYGIPLMYVALGFVFVIVGTFLFSGIENRGFIARVFDLVIVVMCGALLVACVMAGMYIGRQYDMMGWGALAGVSLFGGIFYVYSSIRSSIKNKEDRRKLAERLKKPHKL